MNDESASSPEPLGYASALAELERDPPRAGGQRRRRRQARRPRRPGHRAHRPLPRAHRRSPAAHRRGHRRPRWPGPVTTQTHNRVAASPPESLAAIAARVDDRLVTLVEAERDRWAALDADLAGPFDEINRMVQAGGKRLGRRSVTGASSVPAATPMTSGSSTLGAAFELMHAFALFHDDVMDDADDPTRGPDHPRRVRGSASRRLAGPGESRRFGEGAAILIGDLALRAVRRAARRAPRRRVEDVERAADRAQRRPVPRHPGLGAARAAAREGGTDRPVQERQVHDRTTVAPRIAAGRARARRRICSRAQPRSDCRSATRSRCATT